MPIDTLEVDTHEEKRTIGLVIHNSGPRLAHADANAVQLALGPVGCYGLPFSLMSEVLEN